MENIQENKMDRGIFRIKFMNKLNHNDVIAKACLEGEDELVEWIITNFYPIRETQEDNADALSESFYKLLRMRCYAKNDVFKFIEEVKYCVQDMLVITGKQLMVEITNYSKPINQDIVRKVTTEYYEKFRKN